MNPIFSQRIIASIDIGTTKISVLIGKINEQNELDIIGIGTSISQGMRKGMVIDVALTTQSIQEAVRQAEKMAGVTITSSYIGISGGHIQSINSNGMVPIKSGKVKKIDIHNALGAAQAIVIPQGYRILHILPQYFVIDGQEKIYNPLDMHGIRLEVEAHIIISSISCVQNLIKCCRNVGIAIHDIILEQLASAYAVLTTDERELGVAVLDIGGGTSDLAVYQHGTIFHTKVVPVAGNHFTNDLAIGLRTTITEAEQIKREHACVDTNLLQTEQNEAIDLAQGYDKKQAHIPDITAIVRPRAYEIFSLINEEIMNHNLQPILRTGLVLTGGGSLLKGMREFANKVFNIPVRIGTPRVEIAQTQVFESPIYSTGYGLLMYALKNRQKACMADGAFLKRLLSHMKSWVSPIFNTK